MDGNVIEARGLLKLYGMARAVDAIDLDIRRGEIFGLLGPNGGGKTTMFRTLLGLIPRQKGEIFLDGEPTADWSRVRLAQAMAYVRELGLDSIVVIGGGNVAYDISRTVLRQTFLDAARAAVRRPGVHEVHLCCLESREEMPADEVETATTIKVVYKNTEVLIDPHTSVGFTATRVLPEKDPVVTLATAHAAKFPDAVERATGRRPELPAHMADLFDRAERVTWVANDLSAVEAVRMGSAPFSCTRILMRALYLLSRRPSRL